MTALNVVLLAAGLTALFLGGEMLVRGSTRIAAMLGVSPLIVGLTVVSFGTSAPEIAVSMDAVFSDHGDIAAGNIIGSNICNILCTLGISALIVPLVVAQQLVRLDVPIMIGASVLFLVFGFDGVVTRPEGGCLLLLLGAYLLLLIFLSRRESRLVREQYEREFGPRSSPTRRDWVVNVLLVILGLVLLTCGGNWLVDGAVAMARVFGVSELVIGLTIVAGGTSMPEIVTSIVATVKGERDIAVGNIVGSNIMNILSIGGLASVLGPDGLPISRGALGFDVPVMIAAAVACLPIFFSGFRINRWEGALFLGYYVAYIAYLLLESSKHDVLPAFSRIMWLFVLPLTVVTLLVVSARAWKIHGFDSGRVR